MKSFERKPACMGCGKPTIYAFCDGCAPPRYERWETPIKIADFRPTADRVGRAGRESIDRKVRAS